MESEEGRIDLAHAPVFALGRLTVRPGTRELARDDGAREVLEPRVMQVLVALARADGAIVSRDDLTRLCWEGRVVGEDAINRVLSRLRKAAEGIGSGSFRIETITKVGYRLIRAETVAPAPAEGGTPAPRASRRWLLAAAGAAGAAAVGSAALLWPRGRPAHPVSPDVEALMQSGWTNASQATGDGDTQARGLFRRATELAPDYADAWAALAVVYANETHYYPENAVSELRTRALTAIARARALEPGNADAELAEALLPSDNRWAENERAMRRIVARDPGNSFALNVLSRILARVGRFGEAAQICAQGLAAEEAAPVAYFNLMSWQWAAGQLDDADRTMARGMAIFPRNFSVWFGTFYIKMYTGRTAEAIAMAEDVPNRPSTIPDSEVDLVLGAARALQSGDRRAIAQQSAIFFERAHHATGYAENAIQFLAAAGQLDEAMAVAEAYCLGRGWEVPAIRFPRGQGSNTRLSDRRTWFLFFPMMAPLWHTPRFEALLRAIGLEDYWRKTGTRPDFRK